MVSSRTLIDGSGVGRWVMAVCLSMAALGHAQEFHFESVGARAGVGGGLNSKDFHQAEAFLDWDLPWDWDLGKQWRMQTRLDLSAGWLAEKERHAAIFTVGPTLVLTHERWPVGLEGGVSPTGITRTEFESKDFAVPFQLTTHLGVYWDFAPHLRLGYRYQHMSNGGFSSPNPGLNLHIFSISYRF